MSLCIAALTPSGIIMTADSRQTYRNNAGMTRIGTDNAVKLFRLSEKAAVVFAGRAFFPDSTDVVKNTGWFIEEFRKSVLDGKETIGVKETAERLNDYLLNNFLKPEEVRIKKLLPAEVAKEGGTNLVFGATEGLAINYSFTKNGQKIDRKFYIETISFIVAGYNSDGVGQAFLVEVPNPPTDPVSRNTKIGGHLRIGQIDVVTRIIKGWAPELFNLNFVKDAQSKGVKVNEELDRLEFIVNWGTLTLQDAIDFCVLMTRITESVQRFSDGTVMNPGGITGVGGAIDIAKITPENNFQWIRQKELLVDDD